MPSRNSATDRNFITTGHFSAVCSFTRAGQTMSADLLCTFPCSGTKGNSTQVLYKCAEIVCFMEYMFLYGLKISHLVFTFHIFLEHDGCTKNNNCPCVFYVCETPSPFKKNNFKLYQSLKRSSHEVFRPKCVTIMGYCLTKSFFTLTRLPVLCQKSRRVWWAGREIKMEYMRTKF
jgi:hypothetical protein